MNNQEYSLQILSASQIFKNRAAANAYLETKFAGNALEAEPALAFYEDDDENTSVIIAIGRGDGTCYKIDATEILSKINAISTETDEQEKDLSEAIKAIQDLRDACGFVKSFDENGEKWIYNAPKNDPLIEDAKSLAEAVKILSDYVQKNIKDTELSTKETDTVELVYEDDKVNGGKVLSGNVKISEEGTSDSKSFNDNILTSKKDGLYVAVDLEYDEAKQKLVFSTSKADKDDVVKKEIELGIGEHIDVEEKNEASKPIKVTVTKEGGIRYVSADVELASGENRIEVKDGKLYVKPVGADDMKISSVANNIVQLMADGLFANVDITYQEGTNTLSFTNGKTTKEIKLNSANIINDARYDSGTNEIVISFVLTDGKTDEVRIPVDGLIDSWDVDNTGHSVTLELKHNHPNNDKLSADVNISGDANNILENINGLLTVRGVSDNIKHGATTVAAKLDEIVGTNADNANKIAQEITDRAAAITDVLTKLEQETTARKTEDERIEKIIENLKVEELTQTVKDFKELYNTFQTEWAADKALIEKAIADAESVAERVAQLEKDLATTNQDLEVTKTNLNNLDTRVASVEGNITKNASDIAVNTTKINEETTRATAAESELNTALQGEITRSTHKDTELEGLIKANETNNTKNADEIAAVKQSLNEEVSRAKNKETEIEGNLNNEVNRATAEEARLAGIIANNTSASDKNKADIEVITESVSKLRNELDNEVIRAKAEEKSLSDKIDNLITSSNTATENAIATAKSYTDQEIIKIKDICSSDATDKANAAETNAKTYSDDKLKVEVDKLNIKDNELDGKIAALVAKDTELDSKVGSVTLTKASDLVYQLLVDGEVVGTIDIPKDNFLNDVTYDSTSKVLLFTFETTNGAKSTSINISDLVDTYNAGKGLTLDGNTFNVAVSSDAETSKYLTLTEDNNAKLKLQGITDAINIAKQEAISATTYTVGDGLTVENNKISGRVYENEKFLKIGANGFYTEGIQEAIDASVSALDTTTEGKLNSIKEELEKKVSDETKRATSVEETIRTELENKLNESKTYTDGEINKLNQSVNDLTTDLSNLKTQVATLGNNLDNLEKTHIADKAELNANITATDNKVNKNAMDIATINSTLAALQATLTTLTDSVRTIEGKVDNAIERISKIEGAMSNLIDFGVETF